MRFSRDSHRSERFKNIFIKKEEILTDDHKQKKILTDDHK